MDINNIQKIVKSNGIVFLSYGESISQSLISAMTEALEKEAEEQNINMGISSNLFTIFVELSQNMMNYSKSKDENCTKIVPGGLIIVSKDEDNYYIHSQNVVSAADKEKIEPKIIEVQNLDRDAIRKRYRELRKSGQNTHEKGGGIGFYEIAKRCNGIEYSFEPINKSKELFYIKTRIALIKETK